MGRCAELEELMEALPPCLLRQDLPCYTDYEWRLSKLRLLCSIYLNYWPRKLGDYVVHGVGHSLRILRTLDYAIDALGGPSKFRFENPELFILEAATWAHDVGNIKGRKDHGQKSVSMLRRNVSHFVPLRSEEMDVLEQVILAHHETIKKRESGGIVNKLDGIKGMRVKLPCDGCAKDARVDLLAALFAFVDALDVGPSRASPWVRRKLRLTLESKPYWKAHGAIVQGGPGRLPFVIKGDKLYVTALAENERIIRDVIFNDLEELFYLGIRPIFDRFGVPLRRLELVLL